MNMDQAIEILEKGGAEGLRMALKKCLQKR